MISLKQLEALYWVRELGSYQKAADRISVTQPAISARISAMEDMLGVQLIDRHAGGLGLTRLGIELAEHADKMLLMNESVLETLRRNHKSRIRIALVAVSSLTWGPAMLKAARQIEDLTVEVMVGSNIQINREINSGIADLAFLAAQPQEDPPNLQFSVDYAIGWVGAPQFAPPDGQPLDIKDLRQSDLILYPPNSPLYSPSQSVLSASPKQTGVRHFANSLSTICDMLRQGYGISAMPLAVVINDINSGRLVQIPTTQSTKPLRVHCAHISRQRKSSAMRVLNLAERAAKDFCAAHPETAEFVASDPEDDASSP